MKAEAFVDHGMLPQRAIAALARGHPAHFTATSASSATIDPASRGTSSFVNGNLLFGIVAPKCVEIVAKSGVVYKGGDASEPKPRTASDAKRLKPIDSSWVVCL